MENLDDATREVLDRERAEILERLEDWLEWPMLALGLAWLVLLVLEFTRGLSSSLQTAVLAIWGIFILDFLLKFTVAPRKLAYLRRNWLTLIALFVPALRVFRILKVARVLRAARAARSLRLVRVITSMNRGMRALGAAMERRGAGYVLALTTVVIFAGAAGMFAFENAPGGIRSYGSALWWTAMVVTSLGSDFWPQTPEGRALCFLISLYGLAVFGYVTATLATFFIGRDAEDEEAEVAGARSLRELPAEIAGLRAEIRMLRGGKE